MLGTNRFALKEWAVVVRALTEGRQIVLLRKGGIEDDAGQFRLEHSEFFLYSTFEHQNRKFVRHEFLAEFDSAIREQPANEDVILAGYASVATCFAVTDLGQLRSLSPYHVWNDDYLQRRFAYKQELPLRVLLLRAFKLPPVRVPFRAEYRGCKSWVELDRELSTTASEPALGANEFEAQRETIQELLHEQTPG